MSDTVFIHEVGRDSNVRVQLTFDHDELEELQNIAAAAIDPFGWSNDDQEFQRTLENAAAVFDWTTVVLETLEAEPSGLVKLLAEEE